ncbi:MAG: hypothetical protein N2746_08300 [Deltaproteobacteria bacterium]|nr:hypothetical protein [Deltaproteobacteria bacterium]
MNRPTILLLIIGLISLSLLDCECGDSATGDIGSRPDAKINLDAQTEDVLGDVITDTNPNVCPRGQELMCGICKPIRCQTDSDCNPGQICSRRACVDSFLECSGGDCVIDGMECDSNGQYCHYKKCGKNNECPEGMFCMNTFCMKRLPCNGKCGEKEVCLAETDKCVPAPDVPSCKVSCKHGELLMFADPPENSTFSTCKEIKCECKTLPDLPVGDVGYYSRLAMTKSNEFIASAYNKTYGDLVLVKFVFDNNGNGPLGEYDPKSVQFIDGVPSQGQLAGNPEGIRKGIKDSGPDSGKYTSIGLDASGRIMISYYDVSSSSLKFAYFDGVAWTTHTVDGNGANVGMYSSIAISSTGLPYIAYFQKNGPAGEEKLISKLKLAMPMSNKIPLSSGDWKIMDIDSSKISCRGLCNSSDACVVENNQTTCRTLSSDQKACKGGSGCDSDEKCVMDDSQSPVCRKDAGTMAYVLEEGVGLFPSVKVHTDGKIYIAYYDRTPIDSERHRGNLKLATIEGETIQIEVLDGEDGSGNDTGDVGRFASLEFSPDGRMGIAYYDATLNQLKYIERFANEQPKIEVVYSGVAPGIKEFAGPDCSLAFDSDNLAHIAFQDATNHRLLFASRQEGDPPWSPGNVITLLSPSDDGLKNRFGEGGYGFFISQVIKDRIAYISSMKLGFKSSDEGPISTARFLIIKKSF